jgi:Cysteine-rich CPCC
MSMEDSPEIEFVTCPCCGYKTITGEFDICDVCAWEHNFYQEENPEDDGGPNSVSFGEAQRNFAKLGAKSELHLRRCRKPTGQDKRNPNWKPLL